MILNGNINIKMKKSVNFFGIFQTIYTPENTVIKCILCLSFDVVVQILLRSSCKFPVAKQVYVIYGVYPGNYGIYILLLSFLENVKTRF